jgi:integrase
LANRPAAFDGVINPDLTILAETIPTVLGQARAAGTNKIYGSAFDRWALWAHQYDEVKIFPVEPKFLVLYITHLSHTAKNYATINQAVCAIAWAHGISGLSSPTKDLLVIETLNGIKRMLAAPTNHKEPFTAIDIRKFVAIMDKTSLCDVRNTLMIVFGFSAFLRVEELLNIQLEHVTIHETHVAIHIPKAKTDQLRQGNSVVISKTNGPGCPE